MTENKIEKQNNDLAFIEKLKQDIVSCKDFLKSENKNPLIDKALKIAFNLYEKQNDKGGFLRLLFDYDKNEGWKKASVFKKDILDYFSFCEIDFYFNIKSQKLFLDYKKENVVSFLDYKKAMTENKKSDNEKLKDEALKVKLPSDFLKLDNKKIDLLILRLKLLKKENLKKENQ